jgi:hypothetical protein
MLAHCLPVAFDNFSRRKFGIAGQCGLKGDSADRDQIPRIVLHG